MNICNYEALQNEVILNVVTKDNQIYNANINMVVCKHVYVPLTKLNVDM